MPKNVRSIERKTASNMPRTMALRSCRSMPAKMLRKKSSNRMYHASAWLPLRNTFSTIEAHVTLHTMTTAMLLGFLQVISSEAKSHCA